MISNNTICLIIEFNICNLESVGNCNIVERSALKKIEHDRMGIIITRHVLLIIRLYKLSMLIIRLYKLSMLSRDYTR